jgi:hypothetical protein
VRAEFKKTKPAPEPRRAPDDEFDRLAEQAESHAAPSTAEPEVPAAPPTVREWQLLKLLLLHPDHRAYAAAFLDFKWLPNPAVQRVIQRCLRNVEEELPQGAALMAEYQEDPAAHDLVSSVFAEPHAIPHPEKQLPDVLLHLRNDHIVATLQRLTRELAHPDISDEHRIELLHQQKHLRTWRQQPLAPLNDDGM